MFGVPTDRPGDVHFRLFGFPVRVAIWFWLVALIMGPRDPRGAVLWVACVFVSILVHELGHGLVARVFGFRSRLILYELGGLCVYDAEGQSSNQRIAVLFGGPLAQFLLLGVLILVGVFSMDISFYDNMILARTYLGIPTQEQATSSATRVARELYEYLFQINWLWPLLNLLPIWPLDGGQIAGEVLARVNRRDGRRWGHIVSMVLSGVLALYLLFHAGDQLFGGGEDGSMGGLFRVLFFGCFAFVNYQMLQAYHQRYQAYGSYDDYDPWSR